MEGGPNIQSSLIVIGYSHIIVTYGNLSQWVAINGWISMGLLRGACGMSAGVLAYLIAAEHLKNPHIRMAIKVCGIIAIFSLWSFRESIADTDLVLWVFLFSGLIAAFYVWPGKQHRSFCYLGKLSYPIFLFHYVLLVILKTYFPGMPYLRALGLFVVVLILSSIVILEGCEILQKGIKKGREVNSGVQKLG